MNTYPDGYIERKTLHVFGDAISRHFQSDRVRDALRIAKAASQHGHTVILTWDMGHPPIQQILWRVCADQRRSWRHSRLS